MSPDTSGLDTQHVKASDGRVPRARGLATRTKLLESTSALLQVHRYHDITVADIASEAQTSTATFYQYFPDIASAALELVGLVIDKGESMAKIVRETDWSGPSAYNGSAVLASEFLSFWEEHMAILRVLDLFVAEGDRRFYELRLRFLGAVTDEITHAAGRCHEHSGETNPAEPRAIGAVLVSMLAHVAAHQRGMQTEGIARTDTHQVMAEIIHHAITGR
ncbi:TetR family transcriptional regulator [Nocardia grenadensis]|uniref:TetR family transcriptional regulator n=1 Tax=Nocardia grenadensis TaxID=931537 RepID=UPI0007A4753E|nr:TetR family transcriptional regulator [Nocardia grenadensis]